MQQCWEQMTIQQLRCAVVPRSRVVGCCDGSWLAFYLPQGMFSFDEACPTDGQTTSELLAAVPQGVVTSRNHGLAGSRASMAGILYGVARIRPRSSLQSQS
jgi:hypothetical protein